MNEHRYILEPYKGLNTRHHCPACNAMDRTFSRYIDTITGQHVHISVGRCNRESKCGYHYTPRQYFYDIKRPEQIHEKIPKPEPSLIADEVFKSTLKQYDQNNFIAFLNSHFGETIARELILKYHIGTSKHWPGSTIFWQIDTRGRIRTGKIMLYNGITGKRIKEPFNHITWVHSVMKHRDYMLQQCLFGEHLLIEDGKPIAIVESEKTAIIASVYLPQFLWLAVGSLTNLNSDKCQVLTGRRVVLFPDINGYDKWRIKVKDLNDKIPNSRFVISDLLEKSATEQERTKGLDLADHLLKYNWEQFNHYQPATEKDIPIESPHWLYSTRLLPSMALSDTSHIDSLTF